MSHAKRSFFLISKIGDLNFLEDVSGETLVFVRLDVTNTSIFRGCLRRNSHFQESAKAVQSPTYLDMNGKRVNSKSLARTCTNIEVTCRLGALPDRPQGVPGVHYPRKFRRGPHPNSLKYTRQGSLPAQVEGSFF